jgi:DNA-binding NarL/FixJ family response regulator
VWTEPERRHPDSAPVPVALVHPLRAWVEALEVLLGARPELVLVTAHTQVSWGRHAVLRGDARVLLLGLGAGGHRGLETVLRDLFSERADLRVVVLSDSRDPATITAAVRAGARGWIAPSVSADELVRVVVGVSKGETWIPPDLLTPVVDALVEVGNTRQQTADAFASLTARELDVLRCLAHGMTRREIAEEYVLSPHTVRTHINHVLSKLDVHSTLAAVSLARRVGLTDPPPHRAP